MSKSSKGGAYERELSKALSKWLSEGTDDSWVWRTSQSGGRATTRAKKGKKTSGAYGDLTFTDKRAEWFFKLFTVELKRGYAKAEMSSLLDSNQAKPMLVEFWEQALRDHIEAGSYSALLIVKRDRKLPIIIMKRSTFKTLCALFKKPEIYMVHRGGYDFVIMRLQDWLDWVDPIMLRENLP